MTGDPNVVNACGPQQRNHDYVNRVCAPVGAYTSFVDYIWNHEALHMAADLSAAKKSEGDVHARWEPLVSNYESVLTSTVQLNRDQAHQSITSEGVCTHTGQDAPFVFWDNLGDGWFSGQTTVDESRALHCPP